MSLDPVSNCIARTQIQHHSFKAEKVGRQRSYATQDHSHDVVKKLFNELWINIIMPNSYTPRLQDCVAPSFIWHPSAWILTKRDVRVPQLTNVSGIGSNDSLNFCAMVARLPSYVHGPFSLRLPSRRQHCTLNSFFDQHLSRRMALKLSTSSHLTRGRKIFPCFRFRCFILSLTAPRNLRLDPLVESFRQLSFQQDTPRSRGIQRLHSTFSRSRLPAPCRAMSS